jgi:hypothetical protein|tara:strand:+ start:8275 stop:8535 length:261 start_codon:yes stop_codon:yes gene_type:complete
MTIENIVINWIKSRARSNPNFYSYEFEESIPAYGRLTEQKVHTASSYSRSFRKIRESNTLDKHGIKLTEIQHENNSKVKGWKIETL